MLIAIGSLNPVKRQAAEDVLRRLFPDAQFTAVDAPSNIPAQPRGDAETRRGAVNRAEATLALTGADLAIGFEGGLIKTELGLMTCAWCAVTSSDGRIGIGGGAHMMLPPAAETLLDEGHELGTVMDRISGDLNTKHGLGAIGILTGGLESRRSAYANILRLAMAPFRSPELFTEKHDS